MKMVATEKSGLIPKHSVPGAGRRGRMLLPLARGALLYPILFLRSTGFLL